MKSKMSFSVCTLRARIHLNDPHLPHLEPPHPWTLPRGQWSYLSSAWKSCFLLSCVVGVLISVSVVDTSVPGCRPCWSWSVYWIGFFVNLDLMGSRWMTWLRLGDWFLGFTLLLFYPWPCLVLGFWVECGCGLWLCPAALLRYQGRFVAGEMTKVCAEQLNCCQRNSGVGCLLVLAGLGPWVLCSPTRWVCTGPCWLRQQNVHQRANVSHGYSCSAPSPRVSGAAMPDTVSKTYLLKDLLFNWGFAFVILLQKANTMANVVKKGWAKTLKSLCLVLFVYRNLDLWPNCTCHCST